MAKFESGGGGVEVLENGVSKGTRSKINFTSNATITDDAANSEVEVAITGGQTTAFEATMSSGQSVAANTAAKVQFNTQVYDVGAVYDPTTNYRFVAPAAGKYLITAQFRADADDSNNQVWEREIHLYKNGSSFRKNGYVVLGGSDGLGVEHEYLFTITAILDLSANDYIEVFAKHTLNSAAMEIRSAYASFAGHRLS